MANQTPLASWLYSKKAELNPRFKEFNWPDQVFPGVFDFETKISWGSIEVDGRGVDYKREIALEKSAAEAIERLICKTLNFDSVGLAVAGTHNPSEHAQFEVWERYYLNRHLEQKQPLARVEFESSETKKFTSVNPNATLEFYRMKTPGNLFGIICRMVSLSSKAVSYGFSLSESLDNSVRRSMLEALPSFAWLISGDTASEIPWHIESNFVERLNSLLVDKTAFVPEASLPPQLSKIDVPLDNVSILLDAPIQIAHYGRLN